MRSKKPSAASSPSTPPPDLPPLFLDRSLGRHVIADALRHAGAEVHIHDDHFPPDAPDHVWLTTAGQQGWGVITKDRRIRYRQTERTALLASGVRAFVITQGNLQGREMAQMLVRALPSIARACRRNPAPFIAKVAASGRVSMLQRGR